MIAEVYFAQAESGPVKIGYSTDVPRRLGQLQAGMKEVVRLVAKLPGDRRLENYFHKMLRLHLITGEWFSPVPAVLECARSASQIGLASVPPEFRPLPEYEAQAAISGDDILEDCREYLTVIAGERDGHGKIGDMLLDVSRITGLPVRRLRGIWNREAKAIEASEYIRLRECFEAREAIRFERSGRLKMADELLRKALTG